MEKLFRGSTVALVTPMKEDGKIDYKRLREYIEFHINRGTAGVLVCGTTGEGSTLEDGEFKKIIKEARRGTESYLPLYVGAGSNNTKRAVEKGKIAAAGGADAVLQITPFYNKTNNGGIIRHFETIADSSPVPLIIYNVPSRTGYDIPVEAVRLLSYHPNIKGIKEASSDIEKTAAEISAVNKDFCVYSGNDGMTVPVMSLGGKGVISVTANILPRQMAKMCEYMVRGNTEKAAELQLGLLGVIKALFCEVNPIPVKTAMNILGMEAGPTRLPLYKMSEENVIKLKKALSDYRRTLKVLS